MDPFERRPSRKRPSLFVKSLQVFEIRCSQQVLETRGGAVERGQLESTYSNEREALEEQSPQHSGARNLVGACLKLRADLYPELIDPAGFLAADLAKRERATERVAQKPGHHLLAGQQIPMPRELR